MTMSVTPLHTCLGGYICIHVEYNFSRCFNIIRQYEFAVHMFVRKFLHPQLCNTDSLTIRPPVYEPAVDLWSNTYAMEIPSTYCITVGPVPRQRP